MLFWTDVTAAWALLRAPLGSFSAIDISSTYFQMGTFGTLRSLIISKKSQGPSLVPWELQRGQTPNQKNRYWKALRAGFDL